MGYKHRNVSRITYAGNTRISNGWVKRWLCYLLSRLKLHRPDCKRCNRHEMCWVEIKERIEDLKRAS